MSKHRATVHWRRGDAEFLNGRYSREHTWTFDGGAVIAASSSPALVPAPYSSPENVDPEEAFVAAISSCHMLTFLYLASLRGLQIDSYQDAAVGEIAKDHEGRAWVSEVTLEARIACSGARRASSTEIDLLQHQAHEQCFIANSVRTAIIVRSEVTWVP
jgi:organic hydroperoxide reductase OsmC/OhrA